MPNEELSVACGGLGLTEVEYIWTINVVPTFGNVIKGEVYRTIIIIK